MIGSHSGFLNAFHRSISVLALQVPNALVDRVFRPLRELSIKRPNVRPVRPHPSEVRRRALRSPLFVRVVDGTQR